MTHYSLFVGAASVAFPATSFATVSSGSGTFTVPEGANAIHIQSGVGAGGGAVGGLSYDGAGGESSGPGGGSGAYVSDKVFTVTEGETISYSIGGGGAAAAFPTNFNVSGVSGGASTLSGSTTGSIFSLAGGGGGTTSGGASQGPLQSSSGGTAGSVTINGTAITSGNFTKTDFSSESVTNLTGGPVGTFNQSGNGAVGGNNGNCSGDNCRIDGSDGADSYAGNIDGGSGSSSSGSGTTAGVGTRGSGGGGGAAQLPITFASTAGAAGGAGEIKYRFINVT